MPKEQRSSDSDFTRLAARIRESGKTVYGFGEQKTPRPFVSACDRFVYTEVFSTNSSDQQEIKKLSSNDLRKDTKLLQLLRSAIEASSDENGWANLGPVGSNIVKQAPDFDPRNYGYAKLSELAAAIGLFSTERRDNKVFIKNQRPK